MGRRSYENTAVNNFMLALPRNRPLGWEKWLTLPQWEPGSRQETKAAPGLSNDHFLTVSPVLSQWGGYLHWLR